MNSVNRLSPLQQRSFFENQSLNLDHSEEDHPIEPIYDAWTCESCEMLYREEEDADTGERQPK